MRPMLRSALAALVLLATAQTPAPADAACTKIPLASEPGCTPLVVRAPRATLRLALAANDAQRERGLMFVRQVPVREGMLFVFPDGDRLRDFWMKNTITPLDMVFVRGDGTVTAVAARVPSTTPSTSDLDIPHRTGIGTYVIELHAGAAAGAGIAPGRRLEIPPVTGA